MDIHKQGHTHHTCKHFDGQYIYIYIYIYIYDIYALNLFIEHSGEH